MCIQDYEEWREGAYARDKLNIRANIPLRFYLKVVCEKEGGRIFRTLQYNSLTKEGVVIFFGSISCMWSKLPQKPTYNNDLVWLNLHTCGVLEWLL